MVEGLDLSALERAYAVAAMPTTLLSLLIYGYATGTFSSRKIERATYVYRQENGIICDQRIVLNGFYISQDSPKQLLRIRSKTRNPAKRWYS